MLFSELKCKDVVNLKDCRKIGKICDLEFDVCSGKICCVYITAKNRWCNIFSAEDKIEVEIVPKRKSQKEEAFATFDGRGYEEVQPGDRIRIGRSPKATRLVKIYQTSFYEVLRSKMGDANQ